jgi:hypothetical protein
MVRRAPLHHGTGPYLSAEGMGFVEGRRAGEDRIGEFARKADPGLGRSGLKDHRLALR